MNDFDSPWKDVLDRFLKLFLAFFFPDAHDDIDWDRGYETLDKELAQIMREAESGKRLADKLFKVWRRNGQETWVLIHVEVQAQPEPEVEFTRRIYTYNYRIYDRYQRPVATMVVLGDDKADWRPSKFEYTIWGTKALLEFAAAKLLDYQNHQAELEQHDNPFALIVLAHLQSMETKDTPVARREIKVRLVKNLLERGMTPEDIRQMFRAIDWLLDLPEELSRSFWQEIHEYEEEQKMPYITSTESMLINQGREEGLKEGREEGREEGRRATLIEVIGVGLNEKFGEAGAALIPIIAEIDDLSKLQSLQMSLWKAKTVADVKALIESE